MKRRRVLRWVLGFAAAAAFAGLYVSDALLFVWPERLPGDAVKLVGESLRRFHGICFYVSFDEPVPVSWNRRSGVEASGTYVVEGRFGNARRFSGRNESHISTSVEWGTLGGEYTMSIWLRPERMDVAQYVWACAGGAGEEGFILRGGRLEFHVPGGESVQVLSAHVEPDGKFLHAAATVDAASGVARLYLDGGLQDEIRITGVRHAAQNMEFSKLRWYTVSLPFRGDLDEAAAFSRALPEKEIAALAKARRGILPAKAPLTYGVWRAAAALRSGIRHGLRLVDLFNPVLHAGSTVSGEWPVVELQLSKKDMRHFIREHEESLRSGLCTRRGANSRGVYVQASGETIRCEMALDGIGSAYHPASRASYRLELPPESPLFGETQLRLIAPERLENDFRWLAPNRNGTNGLCRLMINGHAKGIYYFESLNGFGMQLPPGGEDDLRNRTKLNASQWDSLFVQGGVKPFLTPLYLPAAEIEARALAASRLFASDVQHPWSLREWKWRIRSVVERNAAYNRLLPETVLGRNPSAMFVITDLDLAAADLFGGVWEWRSSAPDVLDARGRVNRPQGGGPVDVELTAVRDGQTVPLAFRVMPEPLPVPAVFAYFSEPLRKTHRTELSARVVDTAGRERWLTGIRKNRAGIKWRGNTSFWNGHKKPVGLEFDAPHLLLGDSPARHLALLNGYKDATRMKNRLAYGLFRQFADAPGMERDAPDVQWCELFQNGIYSGVFEMVSRVDADLLGFPGEGTPPEEAGLLFGSILFGPWEAVPMEQEVPSRWEMDAAFEVYALKALMEESGPAEFVSKIGAALDLSNYVDFTLLLNFTGNQDGMTANYFLAKRPGEAQPFFFIPWDYDSTFTTNRIFLANPLTQRLLTELPGFDERLSARWAELRGGALSVEHIDAEIQAMRGPLENVMAWERHTAPYFDPAEYDGFVEEFRQVVRLRLAWLDERYAPEGME